MNVKVELDAAAIKRLEAAAVTAAGKTGEAVLAEIRSAQVMPFDNGTMQNADTYATETYRDGEAVCVDIITDSPQARRLYYHPEYDFQTVNNPNAGGMWYEPWLSGGIEEDFAEETFMRLFAEEAGL